MLFLNNSYFIKFNFKNIFIIKFSFNFLIKKIHQFQLNSETFPKFHFTFIYNFKLSVHNSKIIFLLAIFSTHLNFPFYFFLLYFRIFHNFSFWMSFNLQFSFTFLYFLSNFRSFISDKSHKWKFICLEQWQIKIILLAHRTNS